MVYGGPGITTPHAPVAPSAIVGSRQERRTRYRAADGSVRTITLYDQYGPDDVLVNTAKAVLAAMAQRRGNDRPETPLALKQALCRVGLVF